MPINPLGYSCIKKLQRDNLWHAYNEPINFYSAVSVKSEVLLILVLSFFSLKKRGLLYGYTFLFLFFILFGNLLRNKIKTRTYEVAPNPIKNLILVSSLSSHIFFCPKASKISLSVQLVKPKFSNKY